MVLMRDWRGAYALTQLLGDAIEKSLSAASVVMMLTDYKTQADFWVWRMGGGGWGEGR